MAVKGILQSLVNILWFYYTFPSFSGLFIFMLKLSFFMVTLFIVNTLFEELYYFISKNYKKFIYRGIDTREQYTSNTKAHVSRLDWVGKCLHWFYKFKLNYKRELHRYYVSIIENLLIYIVSVVIMVIVIGFLIIGSYIS